MGERKELAALTRTEQFHDNKTERKPARAQQPTNGPGGTGVQDGATAEKLVTTLEGVARYELSTLAAWIVRQR